MSLEKEMETYHREKPRLLAEGKGGRFLLVKGDLVEGDYGSFKDALLAGYDKFSLEQFMVRQLNAEEPVVMLPASLWFPRRAGG